jgi:hypothetical protein
VSERCRKKTKKIYFLAVEEKEENEMRDGDMYKTIVNEIE